MARANFNRLMRRGGLTLAAALMLTTAGFGLAQAGEFDEPATEPAVEVVEDAAGENGSDVSTGEDGIAVGEPDPSGDGSGGAPDEPVDDGSGSGIDVVIDDPVNDGSGDGTGDWVDDGTGDGTGDWVDDGTGDGSVIDGDTGSDGVVDEGEVVIDYLDGGPVYCDDCEVGITSLPVEAYQMSAGTPIAAPKIDAPVARSHRSDAGSPAASVAASVMAGCLAQHPRLPWICEWQNGAGH